jgi:hypothetical protein
MERKNINAMMIVLLTIFLLSGCSLIYVPESTNVSNDELVDRSEIMFEEPDQNKSIDENRSLITYGEENVDESDVSLKLEYVEGDLIDLQPKATDPDDDEVDYSFNGPFNEVGLWQTKDGDAGKYLITVGASDGDLVVKEYVLVIVHPRNKGPIIECPENIVVTETETVNLDCNIFDRENDSFDVTYSGWMTSDSYETTYIDAGTYTVLVTATDELNNTAKKSIIVTVKNKNRLPVVNGVEDIEATETDIITLDIEVSDPDGDNLTVIYADPFDKDGVWVTEDGDSGSYASYIKVSDGKDTVTKKFNIEIDDVNTRPILEPIPEIVVDEGETVNIDVNAHDNEGDTLTITFSGWMTSDSYETTYDDAGTHYVKVTVSDGRLETSQNVKINVNNVNRPPQFIIPS